jgi:AraC-like DNA-binding protein
LQAEIGSPVCTKSAAPPTTRTPTSNRRPYDVAVRAEWVARLDARIGALLDDLSFTDLPDIAPLLRQFVEEIELPSDRLHGAVFGLAILQAARAGIARTHHRQPVPDCRCHAAAGECAEALACPGVTEDRVSVRTWIDRFLSQVAAAHSPVPAHYAAAVIRNDPLRGWTLKELARRVTLNPVRLSAQFERAFAVRPGEYLHLVRVARAVPLFDTSAKVEAIAMDVGYRSKKDLYGALGRWVGASPTELRVLSSAERNWLHRQLRLRMVSASFDARERSDTPSCRQRPQPRRSVR